MYVFYNKHSVTMYILLHKNYIFLWQEYIYPLREKKKKIL